MKKYIFNLLLACLMCASLYNDSGVVECTNKKVGGCLLYWKAYQDDIQHLTGADVCDKNEIWNNPVTYRFWIPVNIADSNMLVRLTVAVSENLISAQTTTERCQYAIIEPSEYLVGECSDSFTLASRWKCHCMFGDTPLV